MESGYDIHFAGAAGLEIKGTELVTAVRTVATGRSMLDPATTARLMRSLRGSGMSDAEGDERLDGLSDREREVLELIGEGLTNRQISKKMYLSEKTVKNHISRLLAKLGVARRVQAAVIATQVRDHETEQRLAPYCRHAVGCDYDGGSVSASWVGAPRTTFRAPVSAAPEKTSYASSTWSGSKR